MNEEESKALSINAERSEINLDENTADRMAALFRGLLGTVPVVGSMLGEVITVEIPNQRMDRVVLTIKVLAQKLSYIEEEVLCQKMRSEKFTDLLQDAMAQAARSLSDERREYIASFLKNSLTSEELDHVYEKKLLAILGELNDAEIIFLRHASLRPYERQEFFEQHKDVLGPVPAVIGSPRALLDKYALRTSFQDKLLELSLLARTFVKTEAGKMPEMDENTGTLKVRSIDVTQLGRALLRYIDQPASSDKDEDEFLAQKRKISKQE